METRLPIPIWICLRQFHTSIVFAVRASCSLDHVMYFVLLLIFRFLLCVLFVSQIWFWQARAMTALFSSNKLI